MGKYFGTDGFRGEANKTLTVEHAFKVGRYLGWYYNRHHKARIVIGKDTRRSSYMFEYALVAGLTASGADAYLLHVTTTPSVSYIVRTDGFDCGIMISASHNPYYDNGIKLINDKGQKFDADVEKQIEMYIDGLTEELPYATKDGIGRAFDYSMGRNRYIGYLMSIPKAVFDALGAETYVINDHPDGVNINTDCGSTHMGSLQNFVRENGLDIGFAFDGDADRCLAVDEFGRVVDGDLILYVCGQELKKNNELANNTIVTTIMSNIGLYKALDKVGIGYAKTAVGDKYVYENMVTNGNVIGGEQSGHIIFSKHATTGDGILTSLKILETCIENKKTLAQLTEPVTIYPQLLINVRVKDKAEVLNDEDIKKTIEEVTEALGDDGRILVRESGTEPLIRVMVEAQTDEICHENVLKVVNLIKEKGYAVK